MTTMTATGRLRFGWDHHIEDDVLEAYVLGCITEGDGLAPVEEHLLVCHESQDRLAREDESVREIRVALRLEDVKTPTSNLSS